MAAAPSPHALDRWRKVNLLRDDLIAQAMGRGLTREEAEDIASECILRAGSKADLDLDRAPNWLRRVAHNMVVDTYRERLGPRRIHRLAGCAERPHEPQAAVDDRLEASWVKELVHALPPRQRRVLQDRADGHTIEEIAERLDASYKTVESLTSRARATIRQALVAVAALVGGGMRRWRHVALGGSSALVLACAATTFSTPNHNHATVALPAHPAVGETHAAEPPATRGRSRSADSVQTEPHDGRAVPNEPSTTRAWMPAGHIGPVDHSSVSGVRDDQHRTFAQSVEDCVAGGLEVSTSNIGCADGNRAPPADASGL
jgi:RNA polymerase sigma factor (sigma-70 family)